MAERSVDVPTAPRKTDEVRSRIERARARSTDEGCCGVLVERPVTGSDDDWRVHASHPEVPLGLIVERPIDDSRPAPSPCRPAARRSPGPQPSED